jgi:hypothetical protein
VQEHRAASHSLIGKKFFGTPVKYKLKSPLKFFVSYHSKQTLYFNIKGQTALNIKCIFCECVYTTCNQLSFKIDEQTTIQPAKAAQSRACLKFTNHERSKKRHSGSHENF